MQFGLGASSGLPMPAVLEFVLPLCECASDKSRDLAFGLLLDVRSTNPRQAEDLIEKMRPSVLPTLKARLAPPSDAKGAAAGLSVSGKKLPPLPAIGGGLPGGGRARPTCTGYPE